VCVKSLAMIGGHLFTGKNGNVLQLPESETNLEFSSCFCDGLLHVSQLYII
jgi:hypothetical protein